MSGRIIQPFQKPVARILITMDQNGNARMEAENHGVKIDGRPTPLDNLTVASMLSGCLQATIQSIVTNAAKARGLIQENVHAQEKTNPTETA